VNAVARRCLPPLLLLACLAGCVRRTGLNNACEWPSEVPSPLDAANPAHQRHLTADAQFAEELGIRYGDSFRGKETVDERGRRVVECTDRLLAWVAVLHSVTADDVQQARVRRDWRVDAVVVFSPMLVLLGTVAVAVTARIRRRFSRDEKIPALVAVIIASLIVTFAVLLAGELWSWIVEIVRVGNGHLSYRTFRLPWGRYRLEIFAAGLVIFWAIAWLGYRREPAAAATGE
jgi:hypothetical protein